MSALQDAHALLIARMVASRHDGAMSLSQGMLAEVKIRHGLSPERVMRAVEVAEDRGWLHAEVHTLMREPYILLKATSAVPR